MFLGLCPRPVSVWLVVEATLEGSTEQSQRDREDYIVHLADPDDMPTAIENYPEITSGLHVSGQRCLYVLPNEILCY